MTVTTLAYIPSPAQGVWFIGVVPIRAYALCIIIGIIAALVIGDRRWEARGGERGVIYDIALWAVPFGLVGGRAYHVLTDWPTYFGAGGAGLGAAFRIWDGGLGIWGAVALGAVGAWIACRRRGIPLPAFGDAVAPGIILAQAIGRLGNYFNQELYGRATTLPWGLEIYERRDAAGFRDTLNGVSTGEVVGVVHPTFLYELLWNVLIFALLIWVDRRFKLGHGRVFALYVAGYCLGRFWIELMRADTATLIAGIRVNSFTSTFIFIAAVVYIMVAPKGREDPASLRGNAPLDEDVQADDSATALIEVGAVAGVVAAAEVAGASEAEDGAPPGDSSSPADPVVDAADEADDVEEPVETEVLVVAESQPADEVAELEEEAAEEAEGDSVSEDAVESAEPIEEVVEPVAVPVEEADEVAAEPADEVAEPEEEAAEEAEGDSVSEDVVEPAEPTEEVVEEADEIAAEPAEAEAVVVANEVEAGPGVPEPSEEPVAEEAVEAPEVVDAPTADADEADGEEIAAEVLGAVDAATAEAEEGEAVAEEAVNETVDEAVEGKPELEESSEEAAEAETAEGDSGDAEAALTDEAVGQDAVDEPTEEPAADPTPEEPAQESAPAAGPRFRKPRWFRRNG